MCSCHSIPERCYVFWSQVEYGTIYFISLSFGLAFRSGSVSLMVLNNSGLRGLKMVTKARMFYSAKSFDFGSFVFGYSLCFFSTVAYSDIHACINFLVVLLCVFGGFFICLQWCKCIEQN